MSRTGGLEKQGRIERVKERRERERERERGREGRGERSVKSHLLMRGKIPWRRKWQPTAVFLPGESHGQSSLVGYSPWGHKEPEMSY